MKKLIVTLLISLLTMPAFAQDMGLPAGEAGEVVVFSGRKQPLIQPVVDLFEQQTGINVVLKTGKSGILGKQILAEMPNPSADIFIGKELGSLEFMRLEGAFASYTSDAIAQIPAPFRASDGTWLGVSGRSRAVIYNKDLIDETDVPRRLKDLMDPKYKGKLAAVNAGNESFVAWVSALRLNMGDQAVKDFLTALKNNDITLVSKSHTDIRKSIGRGEFPLGLINHYYYHLQRHEQDEELRNVGIMYLDQAEGLRGEIVNVSGAAIVKNAPNKDNAQKFLDFLASKDAQEIFAKVNFEYPLHPDVQTHEEVLESLHCLEKNVLSCLHVMDISLDQLGPEMKASSDLLDEIDWY